KDGNLLSENRVTVGTIFGDPLSAGGSLCGNCWGWALEPNQCCSVDRYCRPVNRLRRMLRCERRASSMPATRRLHPPLPPVSPGLLDRELDISPRRLPQEFRSCTYQHRVIGPDFEDCEARHARFTERLNLFFQTDGIDMPTQPPVIYNWIGIVGRV